MAAQAAKQSLSSCCLKLGSDNLLGTGFNLFDEMWRNYQTPCAGVYIQKANHADGALRRRRQYDWNPPNQRAIC